MTRRTRSGRARSLSNAEHAVMEVLWAQGPLAAEALRDALRTTWPMKDSTARTVLGRLERKGYVTHTVEGRTYIYRGVDAPAAVAARAVKQIIDRLCGGSAEALVVGMVDHDVLSADELDRLARAIARQKKTKS
jgi:predicted transcriptional regulator